MLRITALPMTLTHTAAADSLTLNGLSDVGVIHLTGH